MTSRVTPPKKQAVLLVSIRIHGDPGECLKFANAVADHAEEEFTVRMPAYVGMHYELNLSRWEPLKGAKRKSR